jgi:iron complex outermembrane receptor protein
MERDRGKRDSRRAVVMEWNRHQDLVRQTEPASRLARARRSPRIISTLMLGAALAPSLASAVDVAALDIKRLTLEELADIEVYSASRRLESVQGVASAVYILTNDDIRRSHVTSIPEALRLVPGVQVARLNADRWAVSIRGFNSSSANKLLVLIDGRSVYDPLFSGTFWQSQDVMLEDVDRIEVIRGPGGALWGANAVNGVINIITRHARDTQGGLVAAGGGTEERAFGSARYGWKMGSDHYARVYAKAFERGTGFSPSDNPHDNTQMNQTGFRWDWDANARNKLRVSGDVYSGWVGQRDNATSTQDVDHRGANLLGHWTNTLSDQQNLGLQVYWSRIELGQSTFSEERDTYDVEFQHSAGSAASHLLVWGLGYRNTRDKIDVNAPPVTIDPERREDDTYSAFAQYSVMLMPSTLQLALGTKFEHNEYSGNEWQPNLRLAWTPSTRQSWWASASRAVRVKSRLEADLVFAGTRIGDNEITEKVFAYELGHRLLVTQNFWYDMAAFHNRYKDLLTVETGSQFRNRMQGNTRGLEVAGRWQATPSWRLDVAYTLLKMDLALDPSSTALTTPATTEKSNPHYYYSLRSALDIGNNWQVDSILRVVDDLPALNVPAYTTLDLGLSWFWHRQVELSVVGQNLLDSHHPEQAVVANGSGTEVERGYYVKLRWDF